MWNSIKNLFSKKVDSEEIVEEPEPIVEENIEEEPPPLPDIIEVPWEVAQYTRNLEMKEKQIFEELKEMLFQTSVKEKAAYDMVEKVRDLIQEKVNMIKEAYKVPDDGTYIYESPKVPNKPGYLKKKETK